MLYGAGGAGLLAELGGGLLLLSLPYGNRPALAAWPLLGGTNSAPGQDAFSLVGPAGLHSPGLLRSVITACH